ncbi:hypothetical protein CHS0354_034117 [Potamilus streckersoni]|uniref:Uncharacterized protein n=1 Tax=Potamilus streckersoni TaxID=2493646 RepID=A0AAE0WAJ2_9BIVA|nr:hypothetical protein CHS0354_034117 [Potamilus streckersoni]
MVAVAIMVAEVVLQAIVSVLVDVVVVVVMVIVVQVVKKEMAEKTKYTSYGQGILQKRHIQVWCHIFPTKG